MAYEERAATAAAGLDAPLATPRTLTGQVTGPVGALQVRLAEVLAALAAVEDGGVARMQQMTTVDTGCEIGPGGEAQGRSLWLAGQGFYAP